MLEWNPLLAPPNGDEAADRVRHGASSRLGVRERIKELICERAPSMPAVPEPEREELVANVRAADGRARGGSAIDIDVLCTVAERASSHAPRMEVETCMANTGARWGDFPRIEMGDEKSDPQGPCKTNFAMLFGRW